LVVLEASFVSLYHFQVVGIILVLGGA
jgi:hypothetical protein